MTSKATFIKFYLLNGFMIMSCNMVHPITPAFLTSLSMPDYMFGLALAAMSLTNFMFSPFWGTLSDSFGRLRIINLALLGYALSQLSFMFATSELTVVSSRIFSGVFAGGFIVGSMAYVADISSDRQRSKAILYFVAFNTVSASFGYLLGGFIGDHSMRATFIVQVIFLIVSAVLYKFILIDTIQQAGVKISGKQLIQAANPFSFMIQAKELMTAALFLFLITIFLTSMAMINYDTALNYYIRQVFDFPPSYNGILKAVTGIIGLVANFTINRWLTTHTNGRHSIVVILFICGVTPLIISQTDLLLPFLLWNIVFYTFNAMFLPIQQSLMTKGQPAKANGLLFGLFNSVKALGMIGGSLIAGFAYQVKDTLPFIIAGVVFLVSALLCVVNAWQYAKQKTTLSSSG